jgi:leader peptidase (prepilin peptidase)/N-methyltransferase
MPKALFPEGSVGNGDESSSPFACLFSPSSTTPCCGKVIPWYDNVPIISWLLLRAQCRYCSKSISVRYVAVELVTGLSFAWAFIQFGQTWTTLFYCFFFALLIVLFGIDLETFYLPDCFTYSVLWLGLFGSATDILPLMPADAILGACIGYGLPWAVNFLYWLWRRRDGFGGGDFKLLAALGAWLGAATIIPILAIASVLALLGMGALILVRKEKFSLERMLPFGPFLILAGVLVLVWGSPLYWLQ